MCPTFRRNLLDQEERQFLSLLDHLDSTVVHDQGEDLKVWSASADGLFSVSSFFSALAGNCSRRSPLAHVWNIKAPPRVVAFGWISVRGRILTMDNLKLRGKTLVNPCLMCLDWEETVDHLLRWRNFFGSPCSVGLDAVGFFLTIFMISMLPGGCLTEILVEKRCGGLHSLPSYRQYGRKGMLGFLMVLLWLIG